MKLKPSTASDGSDQRKPQPKAVIQQAVNSKPAGTGRSKPHSSEKNTASGLATVSAAGKSK